MSARCVKLIQSTFKRPIFIYLWLWCCRVLLTRTRYSHFFKKISLQKWAPAACRAVALLSSSLSNTLDFPPTAPWSNYWVIREHPYAIPEPGPPGWHSSRTAWWEISWVNVVQYVEPLYLLWLRVRQQTNFLLTRGEYIRLSSALVSRCSSFITVDNQATVIKSFGEMAP